MSVECALYWDIRGEEVLGSKVFTEPGEDLSENNVECAGEAIDQIWRISEGTDIDGYPFRTTEFDVTFSDTPPDEACAIVSVTKTIIETATEIIIKTKIESLGHNDAPCDSLDNPLLVQRAIRTTYQTTREIPLEPEQE